MSHCQMPLLNAVSRGLSRGLSSDGRGCYCFSVVSVVQQQGMLLQQQSNCCVCRRPFSPLSQPRMMPHCQHSSCSHCIKHYLHAHIPKITCQFCGQQESLQDIDIEYFPKNIILTKTLRNLLSPSSTLTKEEGDTEESSSSQVEAVNFCQTHKLDLEIMCLTDLTRICPHCALFSCHRQHNLKTVKEVIQLIHKKDEQFLAYQSHKSMLDSRLTSSQFRSSIIKKITEHKTRLISEIKKKFQTLHENVKLAEKKAFQDVAKQFREVSQKIGEMAKEEGQAERQYRVWEGQCKAAIQKAGQCRKVEEKVYYYFNEGPMSVLKDGDNLLKEIERKMDAKSEQIEAIISKIRIVENQGIPNSLFNYLNVVMHNNISTPMKSDSPPEVTLTSSIRIKTEECKGPLLNSESSVKQAESSLSPKRHRQRRSCVSSQRPRKQKTLFTRKASKAELMKTNIEDIVTQFCQTNQTETLDLTGHSLSDFQILEILRFAASVKKIKGLRLTRNSLTSQGLTKIFQYIPSVTNLNLSSNQLTDEAIDHFLTFQGKLPQLRIVNLSNNRINQRRGKTVIEHLKRQGLIITL